MATNTNATNSTNTVQEVGSRDKTVPWYNPTLNSLSEETKELLRSYSNLSEDEIIPHIHAVRDQAWEIWPYPCIGQFRFLNLKIPHTPSYPAILERLRTTPEALFLDLGCCFGQDLRVLANLGVPGEALIGVDLHGRFHDMGYALFRDNYEARSLGARLIEADLFDDEGDGAKCLAGLAGKVDVLQASAFLHLFDLDRQRDAGARIVRLMKDEPGSLIVGTQVGSSTPGPYEDGKIYLHNVESFKQLWEEIGNETGSEWRVEVELAGETREKKPWGDESIGKLNFEIFRVR